MGQSETRIELKTETFKIVLREMGNQLSNFLVKRKILFKKNLFFVSKLYSFFRLSLF